MVRIRCQANYTAIIAYLKIDPQAGFAHQYLTFEGVDFFRPALGDVVSAATMLCNTSANPMRFVRVKDCIFRSQLAPGKTAVGEGGNDNIYGGISFVAGTMARWEECSDIVIETCDFHDLGYGIAARGRDIKIKGNSGRRVWIDGIQAGILGSVNGGSVIDDNAILDKLWGDGAYHGDYAQLPFGYPDTHDPTRALQPGNYWMCKVRRNIFMRGQTRAGFLDGQGAFFSNLDPLARLLGGEIENNIYAIAMQRAISAQNMDGGTIRNNTVLRDMQADNTSTAVPRISLKNCGGVLVEGNLIHCPEGGTNPIVDETPTVANTLADNAFVMPSQMAATFANPVFAPLPSIAVVKAGFAPKAGGPAVIGSRVTGAIGVDGAWNTAVSGPVMLPALTYTVIDAMDELLTTSMNRTDISAFSLETGSRKLKGAGAVRMQTNGVTGVTHLLLRPAVTGLDFSQHEMIAWCTDLPENQGLVGSPILSWAVSGTNYITQNPQDTAANALPLVHGGVRGKVWQSVRVSNIRSGSGAGSYANDNRINKLGPVSAVPRINPYSATSPNDLVMDQIIGIPAGAALTSRKPRVIWRLDDARSQYHTNRAVLSSRGIKPTLYIPTLTIDKPQILSRANLNVLKDLGWCLGVDSGPEDEPFTVATSLDQSMGKLNTLRDTLVQWYPDITNQVIHGCYSYGMTGIADNKLVPSGTPATTANSDGSNVLTFSDTTPYKFCYIGMPVRGDDLPGGEVFVTGFVDDNPANQKVRVSQSVPAKTGLTIRLIGNQVLAVTANGTNEVTMAHADVINIVLGSTMEGFDTRVTVTGIDTVANKLTLSGIVHAKCSRASFQMRQNPWHRRSLTDRLYAEGYRTFMINGGIQQQCSLFKPNPLSILNWSGVAMDTVSTLTAATNHIVNLTSNGNDVVVYGHDLPPATDSAYLAQLDVLCSHRDTGLFEFATADEYYKNAMLRPDFA